MTRHMVKHRARIDDLAAIIGVGVMFGAGILIGMAVIGGGIGKLISWMAGLS